MVLNNCLHPGVVLLESYLAPLGITPNRLARDTALGATRIYSLLAGTLGLSTDTALRLAIYFKTLPVSLIPHGHSPGDPRFWLDLQRDYDIARRQQSPSWTELAPRILPYRPAGRTLRSKGQTIRSLADDQ